MAVHLLLHAPALGLLGALSPATPPVSQLQRTAPPVLQLRDAAARAAARAARAGGVVQPTNRHQGPPPPQPSDAGTPEVVVQGGSLRTWAHGSPATEKHITLGTAGRPLDADVEVWDGPNNVPVAMRVYGEDGQQRPVRATVRGRGTPSTVAVRNAGPMEFPMAGSVEADAPSRPSADRAAAAAAHSPNRAERPHRIQGGADLVLPVDASVDAIQIHLASDGNPLTARIEVLQGPYSTKQGIEVYSDDGRRKPVTYVLETPGYGCSIQIDNVGPMEYPLTASVLPYAIGRDAPDDRGDVVISGGIDNAGRYGDPYGADPWYDTPGQFDRYDSTVY